MRSGGKSWKGRLSRAIGCRMKPQRSSRCRLLIPAVVVAVVLMTGALWFARGTDGEVCDPAFHLRFCTITSGTNHGMIRGPRLLAQVNDRLAASGFLRLGEARSYPMRSQQDALVLGIGYRYDGDAKDSDLAATLVLQGGATVPLRKRVHGTAAVAAGEALCMWVVPEEVTNLLSEVRLSRVHAVVISRGAAESAESEAGHD